MAKVIADFKIVGTIDDLNFYNTTDSGNLVRIKGKTGITKKQFKENPVFDRIRQQNSEFGMCSKKAKVFKALVLPFYKRSQDGPIFGRCIQLLLAVLNEDTQNAIGSRTLTNGLCTQVGKSFLVGFEGNRNRPLSSVLVKEIAFDWEKLTLNLEYLDSLTDILWPEAATFVQMQLAIANWNCSEDSFETSYSNVLVLNKQSGKQSLSFDLDLPKEKDLWLCYLHFSFGYTLYNKEKLLPNKFNSTTLIAVF